MRRIATAVVVTAMALAVSAQASEYGWTFEGAAANGPASNVFDSGTWNLTYDYPRVQTISSDAKFGEDAVMLNGSGGQGYMGISSNFLSASMTEFSISMWVKYTNTIAGNTRYLSRYVATPRTDGEILLDNVTSNSIYPRMRIWYGGTLVGEQVSASTGLGTGVWTHLVVVFDGAQADPTNRLRIYVNNIERATSALGTNPPYIGTITHPWKVGNADGGAFPGHMDDILMTDTALTADQISILYNQGIMALIPEPSLVALLALGLGFLALRGRRRSQA